MKKIATWVVTANVDYDEEETSEEEIEEVLDEVESTILDSTYSYYPQRQIKIWPASVRRVRE